MPVELKNERLMELAKDHLIGRTKKCLECKIDNSTGICVICGASHTIAFKSWFMPVERVTEEDFEFLRAIEKDLERSRKFRQELEDEYKNYRRASIYGLGDAQKAVQCKGCRQEKLEKDEDGRVYDGEIRADELEGFHGICHHRQANDLLSE